MHYNSLYYALATYIISYKPDHVLCDPQFGFKINFIPYSSTTTWMGWNTKVIIWELVADDYAKMLNLYY